MNKIGLSQALTLLANAGVVVGLVLLLVELDQNSDLLRAQIHQSRADAHVEQRLNDVESEYLTPILMKLTNHGYPWDTSSTDELTPEELFRFRDYVAARYTDLDNLVYQFQQGFLDEEYYEYRAACAIRRMAPYWEKLDVFSTNSRPSFVAEVRRIMAEYEPC